MPNQKRCRTWSAVATPELLNCVLYFYLIIIHFWSLFPHHNTLNQRVCEDSVRVTFVCSWVKIGSVKHENRIPQRCDAVSFITATHWFPTTSSITVLRQAGQIYGSCDCLCRALVISHYQPAPSTRAITAETAILQRLIALKLQFSNQQTHLCSLKAPC